MDLPNLAEDAAPDGGEEDAIEIRRVGAPPDLAEPVRDHLELAGAAGAIDMESAAKVSGARFAYLLGPLVRVQLALVGLVLDRLEAAGFTPVVPPVLVREEAMYGTGFFPTDRSSIYRTAEDDLYLVGTSEVPLAGLHMDQILDPEQLPIRYAGLSTCFRREAGAAGRDTRGIFRVHQFDKVEMFTFTTPEESAAEHARLLAMEESILGELGIPYRVVDIAVGDLGASAARKFDCEAWIPSQGRYREVTSCSNCTDYQARRLRTRARVPGEKKGTRVVHTLNGTAVAIGRTIIALLENGQRPDGSVALPEALVPYGAPPEITPR
jgi:seryl-tRNA synthetase